MERRIYARDTAHDIKITDNYLIQLKDEDVIRKIIYM